MGSPAPPPDPPAHRLPDREREALDEIAATRGRRGLSRLLVVAFLTGSLAGAGAELSPALREATAGWPRAPLVWPSSEALDAAWRAQRWPGINSQLLRTIESVDAYLERDSVATRWLRDPIQGALLRWLRYGNGQVVVGEDGWLVYHRDFHAAVGPAFLAPATLERRRRPGWRPFPAPRPDPVAGLAQLGRQLHRRGIRLVVVPVPSKVAIYPERLAAGDWREPVRNPSVAPLVAALEREGVTVYDPGPELFRAGRARADLFLDADSHWSPAGVEATARGLAAFLRQRVRLPERAPARFVRRPRRIARPTDLERLLGLAPRGPPEGPADELEVVEIAWPDGRRFRSGRAASDVVLLGDSFSMVYNELGHQPVSAGFPEHLAAALDRPVHTIARHEHNQLAGRTRWLRQDRAALERARVVVYQVAERAFSTQDWTPGTLGGRRSGRRNRAVERAKESP